MLFFCVGGGIGNKKNSNSVVVAISADNNNNKRRRQQRLHVNSNGSSGSGSYDQSGEIQLLQETLDTLRHTLDRDEAELRDSSDELFAFQRCGGYGSNNGSQLAGLIGSASEGMVSLTSNNNNNGNSLSLQSESTMRSIIDR